MAGIKKYYKAGTLTEVLVAMTILSVVISIGFMTIEWSLHRAKGSLEIQAQTMVKSWMADSIHEKKYEQSVKETNTLTLRRNLEPYQQMVNIALLHISAYGPDKTLIYELKEIIELP